jgi:fatty-acyl-CoA synthase
MPSMGIGFLNDEPARYHAQCRPEKLACVELATGVRLTYRELDARIACCAAQLRAMPGGAIGERIAYLGRNSIDLVVLAMACHRAGAVFAPLNWRLTGTELQALVAVCKPKLLIHDAEFENAARTAAGGVSTGERTQAAIFAPGECTEPPVWMDPAAPCTLLFTSGTTGRPKATIITRAGMFFSALNFSFIAELGPDCTILSDGPMFHTVGLVATMRTALTMGATLVITDRFAPAVTLRALSNPALGITHYFGVPQIAAALRNHPDYAAADLSRLHAIFVGGAPLPHALLEQFLADGVRLVNGYGLSEVGTVMHMPIDAVALAARPGSVGLPAPLIETRIVRLDGSDADDGEVGELWLRGPSVTLGYWNDPDATAAAFRDGWYRTGDLARRDAEGFHWLVDRLKDMYISGGENVYPAEVENALSGHAAIADVAILGVPHDVWGETGAAFIVRRAGATLSEADVMDFCAARLARYKHPASVRFVEAIPRTASGKIQRHLLRALHAVSDTSGETP